MKKFILSVLAVSLTAGAFAQELSKEEQKALKEQQKAITANLDAAVKAAKLKVDENGNPDVSKVPDFATARAEVAKAFANSAAYTKLGDINRVAADIEYNESRIILPKVNEDENAQATFFKLCGDGFMLYQEAWNAYANPDSKGKTNSKYNDAMSAKAWELYRQSNGLEYSARFAYIAEQYETAAKFFQLSVDAVDSPMIKAACDPKKNPSAVIDYEAFANDSVKYNHILLSGASYAQFDKAKAIDIYKSLIGKNTPQLTVYSSIISEYSQMNDTTEMINWLQKGMIALPNEQTGYGDLLLQLYLSRNDIEGAISATNANLAVNPNSVDDIILLGRLNAWKGDMVDYSSITVEDMYKKFEEVYTPAEDCYKKALSLDANSLDANLYYAQMYMLQLDKAESVMLKNHKEGLYDSYQAQLNEKILPLLRKAFQLDAKHENNDVCNWLMQTLYKKFSPSSCPAAEKASLKAEYEEVKAAYGR